MDVELGSSSVSNRGKACGSSRDVEEYDEDEFEIVVFNADHYVTRCQTDGIAEFLLDPSPHHLLARLLLFLRKNPPDTLPLSLILTKTFRPFFLLLLSFPDSIISFERFLTRS